MDLHVWSYLRPDYIFQVSSKSVQGFWSPGGQNLAFPITLASRVYNSLYYRTSRDVFVLMMLTHVAVLLLFAPSHCQHAAENVAV